jgi:hypothetical protein
MFNYSKNKIKNKFLIFFSNLLKKQEENLIDKKGWKIKLKKNNFINLFK